MAEVGWRPEGLLGGYVYAEGERREKQTHEREIKMKDLELQKKAMEVEDVEYETPVRRAEADVKLQRAEREKKLAPKIDRETELKIDANMLAIESAMDVQQIENMAAAISEIRDDETFQMAMDHMKPVDRRKWGLDKVKTYKEAIPILKYIEGRGMHTMEQLRALELTGLKGMYETQAAAASVGWTPEGPSTPFGNEQQAAVMQRVVADHDFYDLYDKFGGVGGDPTKSDEVLLASRMAADEARQILTENEAARRADKTQRIRSIGWGEAIDLAKERTKAFLFKEGGESITGTPMLKLYNPDEAQEAYSRWATKMRQLAMSDATFQKLPPERQERYLQLVYIEQQRADMMVAKAKMYDDVTNRTE